MMKGVAPRTPRTLLALYGAAGLLAAAALVSTLVHGVHERGTALAFCALVAVGELARPAGRRPQEPTLAAAGGLGYALLTEEAGRPVHHGVLQIVAVVVAASLAGCVPHVAAGRGPHPDQQVRRVLTVAFAAVCVQPLRGGGPPGGGDRTAHLAPGPLQPLLLVALLAATVLLDAVLAAALTRARTGRPLVAQLTEDLRAGAGAGAAVVATGAALPLGVAVAGLGALPLFALPLLLVQLACRRYAAVRATYRQTVASLARATEIAGCTPPGHAHRVAALSRAIGRELGLHGHELTVLEYAALTHDTGQLSLLDPVPHGATAVLAADEQRRIARLGGAVVRRTGVDTAVAEAVEQQAAPYREQPLAARIVRTANAYDEMVRATGPEGAPSALERLRTATACEYQPAVVEALGRVLARGGGPGGRCGGT